MQTTLHRLLSVLVIALISLLAQSGQAIPIIVNVVETGGDNEPTDTITAKWTGVTFPVSVANEPVPGLIIGANYTVGLFGNHAATFVDRNHRYTNAEPVQIPSYLVGQEYIMSGNDNRENGGYLLDVTVNRDVQVYLLVDNRLNSTTEATANPNDPPTFGPGAMQWVLDEGWAPVCTGNNRLGSTAVPDEVGIDESANGSIDQYYSVYTKRFPAGTFQIRQADNPGRNMYGAVIAPASAGLPSVLNIGGNKIGTVTDNGGGSITIVGGGNDIWDDRDEFTYSYTEVTGDFDVQVRVESLTPNARWSKAGLMARESLSEYGRMAFARVTPADVPTSSGGNGANDHILAYRTGLDNSAGASGGQHEDRDGANPIPNPNYPNAWLRLVRSGNVISSSNSLDGVAWNYVSQQDTATWGGGALPGTLNVGLATARHSGGPTATAEFRNFQFNYGASFDVRRANSRGNPNGITVEFSKPPGNSAFNEANYALDGGITVSDVLQGNSATSVRLVTSTLTEGTTYTVTVIGGSAADGTPVTFGADTASFVHGAGYEARAIRVSHNKTPDAGYYPSSDAVRKGLGEVVHTGDNPAGFPGVEGNTLFEDPIADTGGNERFSSRVSGVLNITTSGSYTFYMSSDDTGYLYLSSNDQPANKVQIAREPVWNGVRQYLVTDRRPGLENRSAPIALQAGNKYYLELIFSEGGGGNNGSAAWLPPGGPAVANGSSPIPDSAFTPSRLVNGESFTTLGPVLIVQQPASQSVVALQPATFGVKADGTPAYTYEWRRNGLSIPGANGATYTIPVALPADDQSQYSVLVGNEFSCAVSAAATLTVLSPNPPHLLGANADASFTQVFVRFDNRLDPTTAQDALNYSIPGLTVNSATRDASGRTVVLGTTTMSEGATYTVTVSNVRDETGITLIDPNPSSATFSTLVFSPGYILKQFTTQFSGGNVDPFVAAHRAGTVTYQLECLTNLYEFNASDSADNYGGHMAGYFVPTVSGDHVFYIASDDPSRLFLSTDANVANAGQIAFEPAWAGRREWTGEGAGNNRGGTMPNISAPKTLVAGQRYFIDSFFTEGGGGDHMAVAVQGPGDPVPANGSTPITAANLGVYADPAGSSLAITTQPMDRNVAQNGFATFSVVATGSTPLCGGSLNYQWRKDGINISGANGPSYTFGPAQLADDGSLFSVVVNVPGRQLVSADARLGVVADTDGPTLVRAIGSSTFDKITVVFNELVETNTAQDTFSYTVVACGTVVTGLRFTTANDASARDPMTFTLEGTIGNTTTGPWTLIASGNTGLPTTRFTTAPDVLFANSTAYISYRLLFPTVRDSAAANSMQIAEVAFLDAGGNDVTMPGNPVVGVRATAGDPTSEIAVVGTVAGANNYPAAESPDSSIDDNNNTKYLNFAELNTGIIVTPPGSGATLNVNSAMLNPDGMSVMLLMADLQTENTLYCVIVSGVDDLAGNRIAPSSQVAFRSFVTGCGGLLFEAYNTGGGNAVSILTSHPDFPNNPRERLQMTAAETRTVYPDDSHEGYGARIRGLFIPPVSGNWIFYIASDDASQFFLNPTGPSAAGKIMIQEETGCCNTYAAHASSAYPLMAGEGYYIEALYKEGTGGDFFRAAARLQGQPAPTGGTASPEEVIPGGQLGYPAAPPGIGGPVNITQQPASQTVVEGSIVTFSVGADNPNGLPLCYQWCRDGVDIPGATGPSYTIGPVSLADDGARFLAKVSVIGSRATSAEALLRVLVDDVPPACVSASVALNLSNIVVRFSEFIAGGESEDTFNYAVPPFNVNSVVRNADGMSVTVTLDGALAPGQSVTVTVQNVKDLAGNPISGTCSLQAGAPVISCGIALQEIYFGIGGVNVADLVNSPNYPGSPNLVRYKGTLEANTADEFDNYGTRLSGYISPPVSGDYTFYLAADDGAEFWLSTDANPGNISRVAFEPLWASRRNWTGEAEGGGRGTPPANITAPIALVAGQYYYYQALMKEGGGGDHVAVAIQGPGDPVPADGSTPIPGTYLFALADPVGASITFTRQPCPNNICLAIPGQPAPPAGGGSPLASQDFNGSDGGCTVINNRVFEGPWTYNAGAGSWRSAGQGPGIGAPGPSTRLTCPPVAVTQGGNVRVSFNHRHSFEGGRWDGGQLQVSVNGGAFVTVPSSSFLQNGYNGTMAVNNSELGGQLAFVEDSANYAAGNFITSVAELGCFSAGDTISVRFLASFDDNTRAGDPAWELDSVSFSQAAPAGSMANFAVGANAVSGGSTNAPLFFQWQRSAGGGAFADVPGASSSILSFVPTLADNGSCYRALLFTPGLCATSEVACLTVVQPNTPPMFTCNTNRIDVNEDAGPQVVPNWATDIKAHSISRIPTAYANNFNSGPAGMQLAGNPIATISDGVLKLTTPVNSAYGAGSILAPTATYESLQVSWKSYLGDGNAGADGYSLSIGDDVPADPGYGGEEGIGTGLIVAVDTFDNGAALDPCTTGIEIKWRGNILNCVNIPKDNTGDGRYLRKSSFVDASVSVDATGLATLTYDGNVITAQLPAYAGIRANRALFWARTGGANDNQWIDDFSLVAFPFDSSSAEAGQTVSFEVSNDCPGLFSQPPAVSPDGTLSYTPAPNAYGTCKVTVVAVDSGGTDACGGSDRSEMCMFFIDVIGTNDCPTIVGEPLKLGTAQDVPLTFQLPVIDKDGDRLLFTINQPPQHGILVLNLNTGAGTYTPNPGFCGSPGDMFGFTVTDGICTKEAKVRINVLCCAPTAVAKASPNCELRSDQTSTIVISVNNSNGCVTLDGSMSTDPQGGAVTYLWLADLDGDGVKEPFASGAIVTNCFDLGEHDIMLVVDNGRCAGTASITVEVLSACEAVELLIDKVNNADLGRRNKRPLIATLKAACASFDRGNCVSGVNQLEAFQNKVRAQIGGVNAALADEIIALTQEVLDCIDCEKGNNGIGNGEDPQPPGNPPKND